MYLNFFNEISRLIAVKCVSNEIEDVLDGLKNSESKDLDNELGIFLNDSEKTLIGIVDENDSDNSEKIKKEVQRIIEENSDESSYSEKADSVEIPSIAYSIGYLPSHSKSTPTSEDYIEDEKFVLLSSFSSESDDISEETLVEEKIPKIERNDIHVKVLSDKDINLLPQDFKKIDLTETTTPCVDLESILESSVIERNPFLIKTNFSSGEETNPFIGKGGILKLVKQINGISMEAFLNNYSCYIYLGTIEGEKHKYHDRKECTMKKLSENLVEFSIDFCRISQYTLFGFGVELFDLSNVIFLDSYQKTGENCFELVRKN